nr:MAG: RNA-dependent RNA polymerase [Xiaogan marna-like virus 1]
MVGPVAKSVDAVVLSEANTPIYDKPIPAWTGWAREMTVSGDCGMPLVTYGSPCAAIVGIHMMASATGQVWSAKLDADMVATAVAHFAVPILQCRVPEISAPSKEKKLTGLRQWSPLRWVEEGSVKVFGSYEGFQPTPRSKVQKTLLSDIIIKERNWDVDAAVPIMKDWRPWRLALVDVVQQQHGLIDTKVLDACAQAFADDILGALPKEQLETIQVLSDKATINGIPGVKFIDKMNFKSSIGEPYRKSKKEFLSGPIGDKVFDPEVQARIDSIIKGYEEGVCACPIFGGQLKDEVRSKAKVSAGKLRVFLSGAGDWSFVVRKYFLSTVKLIQENPFIFEASPGCAAQSAEWEEYYEYLTKFGYDRLVAGDYGKFDKKMAAYLILKAFWILIQLHKAAGWTDEQCLPLWCIAEDTAYAFCNFGGDLVQFFGSNPSGHPLTVIINCLVNALYMRYCFVNLAPKEFETGIHQTGDRTYDIARNFKKFVALLTYGDDNTMGVSRETPWFCHTSIQRVLATIGVEYTMADKESESVPYIHIRDVSYLKRRWRWDEDIQAVVCPLEEASIKKMLTWCLPSGEESPEFHMASVMVSAINEWFWYGRETFEHERAWLIKLAQANGILQELMYKGFPTWEQLYDRYWKASEGVITKRSQGCFDSHPRDIVA